MTAPLLNDVQLTALKKTISEENHIWINPFGKLDKPDDLTGLSSSEITQRMHEFLSVPKGITYCIVVERDDKILMFKRQSCPCYGDLAKYQDWPDHKGFGEMNPYHPSDLYFPFPSGRPVSIGMASTVGQDDNPFFRALLQDSCYSEVCKGVDLCFKDSSLKSLVFTDMEIDPTLWWHFMIHLRGGYFKSKYPGSKFFTTLKSFDLEDREAVDLTLLFEVNLVGVGFLSSAEIKRVVLNDPKRISGGTFAEGFGYTRPLNEYIFGSHSRVNNKPYKELGFREGTYGDWSGEVKTKEQVEILRDYVKKEVEKK